MSTKHMSTTLSITWNKPKQRRTSRTHPKTSHMTNPTVRKSVSQIPEQHETPTGKHYTHRKSASQTNSVASKYTSTNSINKVGPKNMSTNYSPRNAVNNLRRQTPGQQIMNKHICSTVPIPQSMSTNHVYQLCRQLMSKQSMPKNPCHPSICTPSRSTN